MILRFVLILFAIILIPLSLPIFAQEEAKEKPKLGWQNEVVGNLNFTQTSFSNWAQGGEDTWSWQLDINGKFVQNQQKFKWETSGKISFGKTKVGDAESRKAADEIRLESVFTYKLGVYVNPYIAATGQTQFTEGFDFSTDPKTKISNFMDPAYFTESVGVGYEPYENFKTRLGMALKQTIADEFAVLYSDDPETTEIEDVRSEVGVESITDFSKKVMENILFTTKLELFSDLQGQTLEDPNGNVIRDLSVFDRIDVRWDSVLKAQVNKYVTVSFNVQLFYDSDINIKRQLKQVLAAGLTYSFL